MKKRNWYCSFSELRLSSLSKRLTFSEWLNLIPNSLVLLSVIWNFERNLWSHKFGFPFWKPGFLENNLKIYDRLCNYLLERTNCILFEFNFKIHWCTVPKRLSLSSGGTKLENDFEKYKHSIHNWVYIFPSIEHRSMFWSFKLWRAWDEKL